MGGWSKETNNWLKPGPVQVFCVWLLFLIFPAAAGFAGETGSGGWTTGNLLGFLIQVGIFILAAAGIRRLAGGGGGE